MMSRLSGIAVLMVALSFLAPTGTLQAQWPDGLRVVDTPHNLTVPAKNPDPDMVNQIADYDEICVYCHTPHGAGGGAFLWNRPSPSGPFRMYDEGTDMPIDPQPTGNSLRCLSCHDGTIGLDVVTNRPNTFSDRPGV